MHLVIQDINQKLAIRHVAKVLGLSEGQVYKLGQPWEPGESGRPPTLQQVLAYLEMAATADLPETDELFSHFAQAAKRKAFGPDLIEHMNIAFRAINNGGKLERPKQGIADRLVCNTCNQPRQVEVDDGRTAVFTCRNPICVAHREGK